MRKAPRMLLYTALALAAVLIGANCQFIEPELSSVSITLGWTDDTVNSG